MLETPQLNEVLEESGRDNEVTKQGQGVEVRSELMFNR